MIKNLKKKKNERAVHSLFYNQLHLHSQTTPLLLARQFIQNSVKCREQNQHDIVVYDSMLDPFKMKTKLFAGNNNVFLLKFTIRESNPLKFAFCCSARGMLQRQLQHEC